MSVLTKATWNSLNMWKDRLRCKGNKIDQDLAATEVLYAFRLNRAVRVSVSTLKKESRLYLKPVFAVRDDGTEGIEQIAELQALYKNE